MTKRELERLKQDFEKGVYIKKSTAILLVVMTLCLGLFLGNLLTVIYTAQPQGQGQQAVAPAAKNSAPQQQMSQQQANRIIELERLTRNEPDNVGAWRQLGNAYYDTNRPKNAITAYEKSLQLDPNSANVWTDLGTMYRRDGQFQKAIECYDRAIALQPTHQNALFNKGIVYYHDLGQKDKGVASWEALLKVNPSAKTPQGQSLKDFIQSHKQ